MSSTKQQLKKIHRNNSNKNNTIFIWGNVSNTTLIVWGGNHLHSIDIFIQINKHTREFNIVTSITVCVCVLFPFLYTHRERERRANES